MARTVEQLLVEANTALKIGRAGVRIETSQNSNRLYLRATLPPKPRSGKSKPYQQRTALGIYANHDGVKRAKAEAQRLASDLALGRFDWSHWATLESLRQTCADWIAAFEKEYFTQRARTGKTQTTWDGDYAIPFRRLPAEEDLTAELLVEITTLSTQPNPIHERDSEQ